MKRILSISATVPALLLSMLLFGCGEDQICGGPCTYTDYPGIATIRSVTPDTSLGRNCDNAVIIVYDFAPDDSSAVDRYRFPVWPDTARIFHYVNNGSVPVGWADKEGMTQGSEHPCIRQEIRTGTCSPLIFEFPDVDVSDWPDYCD